jgi:general secretion pathway protein M
MSGLPDGTPGKILAVSIAALLLAILYVAIVVPLAGLFDANAQALEDRRAVLVRYEQAARDLPRLRDEGEARGQQPGGGLLLAGSSDAVAAADLQSALKELVEADGATLESAQTLPAETIGAFRRVGVRLAFSGSLDLLTSVLLGIEASNPVLSVGGLELRSSEDDDSSQNLTIAMDVYGFRSQ